MADRLPRRNWVLRDASSPSSSMMRVGKPLSSGDSQDTPRVFKPLAVLQHYNQGVPTTMEHASNDLSVLGDRVPKGRQARASSFQVVVQPSVVLLQERVLRASEHHRHSVAIVYGQGDQGRVGESFATLNPAKRLSSHSPVAFSWSRTPPENRRGRSLRHRPIRRC